MKYRFNLKLSKIFSNKETEALKSFFKIQPLIRWAVSIIYHINSLSSSHNFEIDIQPDSGKLPKGSEAIKQPLIEYLISS